MFFFYGMMHNDHMIIVLAIKHWSMKICTHIRKYLSDIHNITKKGNTKEKLYLTDQPKACFQTSSLKWKIITIFPYIGFICIYIISGNVVTKKNFDVMKYVLIWSYIFYHSKLLEAITLSFIIFRKPFITGETLCWFQYWWIIILDLF